MSCFPESTYSFYVDGELAPDEARLVDAHLVQCRSCRALVVALQDEARLLADVLNERARQSFARAPRAAPPPRELALGVLPIVALGVVAMGVFGWILEVRLPSGIEWLNPFRLQGAYEMAFDLLFMVRDEVPGLIELLVASAGVASVSMLLLFSVTVISRRFSGTLSLLLVLCALLLHAAPSAALDLHFHEREVGVAAGETVEETMVVNADTVRIDGTVEGDLFVALAERLILRGEVRGNVFAAARTVEMSGKVTGNLHAIGESVRVDGQVEGNLYSVSELVTLAGEAVVERDSTHVASGTTIDGEVKRDLFTIGEWLEVRGSVGRDVDTRADRVSLLDTARVGGDVDALFWSEAEVDVAPGAAVAGEIRSQVQQYPRHSWTARYGHLHYYLLLIVRLAAAFSFGMVLYALFPRLFAVHLETAAAFGRSVGTGFLFLVATPIALGLVAVTLLGIPLALVGLAAFATAVYASGILIAALLGTQLTKPEADTWGSFGTALIAGLAIVLIATQIPFIGVPIRFVVVLAGLGLLVEQAHSGWRGSSAG